MINSETTVPTPRALAGAGPPPQTAALRHTQNPGCPRAASPAEGGTPAPNPAPSPKAPIPRSPDPQEAAVHPDDPPHPGSVGSSLGARYPPASPLQLPRTLPGPAQLEASRSRYPASPRAWNPLRAARRPRSPPPAPLLPRSPGRSSGGGGGPRAGQGRSRLRAASQAWLAAGGGPAVSQRGRPARAARGGGAEDGLGRALGGAGGGAGARGGVGWWWGGGGSGPYKRRGQGGREASVRPMCRPPGAGVGAARAMRAGWAGGRRGAKRSRLGA